MWGFLSTSHFPITANENLANKYFFCLGLLANLADLLRPVDSRSIVLDLFDTFSPSLGGIPLGVLDDCWANGSFDKFYFFRTPSESGHLIASDTGDPLLTVISWHFCTGCNDVIIFPLFFGETLGMWVGVSLGYFSISVVNQVSLRLIFSSAPLCELCCKRSVQFGSILTSLMNGTV